MSDIADTALRRMARDLKLALPNSIRITDGGKTLEFLMTRSGGRYRTEGAGFLDFSQPVSSLSQLGPLANGVGQSIVAGDLLVIYNLGIAGADAYAGDNSASITGIDASVPNEPVINFTPKQFPFESPDARFQVVEGPVSYAFDSTTGALIRYSGYPIAPMQQAAASLAASSATRALTASNVTACSFTYTPGATARSGVVALSLQITLGGESVQLYQAAHVSNVP
jgi:MSHA biogenesis protein MshO